MTEDKMREAFEEERRNHPWRYRKTKIKYWISDSLDKVLVSLGVRKDYREWEPEEMER